MMDTFESAMSSFDASADQNSFMEYFTQQNSIHHNNNQSMTSGVSSQNGVTGGATPNGVMSNGTSGGGNANNSNGHNDISSPTSALLRSSASPTNYDQTGDTTIATTVSTDSPTSSAMRNGSITSSTAATPASTRAAKIFAASHQIHPHPIAATPIRHSSMPFDQSQQILQQKQQQQQQQQQQPQMRFMAGSSSRQLSMGSPSSNPGSPNVMRPPAPIQTNGLMNGTPNGVSDYLNPNSSITASPSPLRSASPLSASSAGDGSMRSPRGSFNEGTGNASPMVPSQSPRNGYSPYASMFGTSQEGQTSVDGTPNKDGKEDASSNAASAKFVHKLFRMVSDTDYQHLISWNTSGTSVVVTNFDEFAKEVLGKHFKHSNFSSFIRQLNMYGFYKVNKTPRGHRHAVDTQIWEFSHPKFIRGHPELLDDIRRKALDSEHARVEARDLQYSVSVGHMQLRHQVDEQQYRLDELTEMNVALRRVIGGLRDTLSNVLDWVKLNNNGQLPFENRLGIVEMPPTPMFHPYMQDSTAWGIPPPPSQGINNGDMVSDGPPIFVTEPAFHSQQQQQQQQQQQHDVFSMAAMGQVSPMASRRVSASSVNSEGIQNPHPNMGKLSLDTQLHFGNPGLGVMGLNQNAMNTQMVAAMNTPLPPSPNIHNGTSMGYNENSPFIGSPSMASFPGQGGAGGGGYFTAASSPMMMNGNGSTDEDTMLGPNPKAMRTPLKRTASNSGAHQMAMQAALQSHAQQQLQQQQHHQQHQQKRKAPAV